MYIGWSPRHAFNTASSVECLVTNYHGEHALLNICLFFIHVLMCTFQLFNLSVFLHQFVKQDIIHKQ